MAASSRAATTVNSRSVSKTTGPAPPSAGFDATCVPAGTSASVRLPEVRKNVSGTRAGCGGKTERPSMSRYASRFFSGVLFSRCMTISEKRLKMPTSAALRPDDDASFHCGAYTASSLRNCREMSCALRGSIFGAGSPITPRCPQGRRGRPN